MIKLTYFIVFLLSTAWTLYHCLDFFFFSYSLLSFFGMAIAIVLAVIGLSVYVYAIRFVLMKKYNSLY